MGSPSAAERPASAPSRRKLTIGPGPASGASKLNMLRPHGPEKSGMGATLCAFAVGASSTRKASKDFFIAALSGSEIRLLGGGNMKELTRMFAVVFGARLLGQRQRAGRAMIERDPRP